VHGRGGALDRSNFDRGSDPLHPGFKLWLVLTQQPQTLKSNTHQPKSNPKSTQNQLKTNPNKPNTHPKPTQNPNQVKELLQANKPVRDAEWTTKEVEVILEKLPTLLTTKPIVYLVNMSMGDFQRKKNKWLAKIHSWVQVRAAGFLLRWFWCDLEACLCPCSAALWLQSKQQQQR